MDYGPGGMGLGNKGEGPEGRKRELFEIKSLDDRNRLSKIMFPGSTVSHTFVNADEVQKTIMEKKLSGTGEFDYHDVGALRAAWAYDQHPDVVARRQRDMSLYAKFMLNPELNNFAYYGFNACVGFTFARMCCVTTKTAFQWACMGALVVIPATYWQGQWQS